MYKLFLFIVLASSATTSRAMQDVSQELPEPEGIDVEAMHHLPEYKHTIDADIQETYRGAWASMIGCGLMAAGGAHRIDAQLSPMTRVGAIMGHDAVGVCYSYASDDRWTTRLYRLQVQKDSWKVSLFFGVLGGLIAMRPELWDPVLCGMVAGRLGVFVHRAYRWKALAYTPHTTLVATSEALGIMLQELSTEHNLHHYAQQSDRAAYERYNQLMTNYAQIMAPFPGRLEKSRNYAVLKNIDYNQLEAAIIAGTARIERRLESMVNDNEVWVKIARYIHRLESRSLLGDLKAWLLREE